MSYQTELSAIAIAIANSSFSNVVKLARLVAIYGDKKEVKVCWADVCENNGLSSSTSKDYWTLSVSFGFLFTDYQATRDLQVKQTEAKFSDLGVDSLKKMKTYKICASKLLGFESSLKTMRSSNGQDNELEALIKLVTDSKGKTLTILEANLVEVENYLASLAEKAAKEEAAREEAAKEEAAKEEAAKEEAAKEEAAKEEAAKEEAAKDEAAKDEAAKDEAAKDEAAKDEAAKDAPVIDNEQMAMLLASVSLLTLTQCENLEKILESRFESLRLAKKAA